ncbi:Beta-glucuronidase [Psilocybe cubensis]|uniref:Beta-glucuronidase C-terminal domain-containing protein n=2 Tax=Psilocybe cubensis TaxID=181762 RepID=A0A8H7Y0I1_PSICU|nr:Beta-glucuronidase [Psilocybe cubensis]KAH9481594.1 Beta-glucuronidase [Psilocybe cubensis]
MPSLSYPQHLLLLLAVVQRSLCADVNVSIPLVAPSTAPVISPSLVSFSIEQDRWTDWVGTTSRNQFFFNTLDNLRALTGEPPQIRIGANSEDHTDFSENVQFSQATFPAISATVPYPEASSIIVGDGFYEAAQFLPPNTHVIWGLNLGQNNVTAAFLEAKSLVKAFASSPIKDSGITLDAIEIGNEADLYSNNGLRSSTYTSTQYVKEWIQFATNVTAAAQLSLSSSSPKFWGAAFAGSSHSTSGFSPQAIFSEGILSSAPGALISTISEHRYSGSFCSGSGGLLQDLMTKSTIRSNLTQFTPDISATHAKGLDYVLGETNSYSCHGAPGVSNTAGAALWTLDYLLFATQIGISRVFFHEGIGFKYNLIQPLTLTRSTLDGSPLATPLPPHIQPQYYAAIIAGEAIGSTGNTRAVELSINNARISGYAFYEEDTLARAILINSQAFFTTDKTNRTSTHVDLAISGSGAPTEMTVKRLFVPHADDTTGLTWGGQTYETSDARVSGSLQVETASVSDGVDIQETEVVMLSFL